MEEEHVRLLKAAINPADEAAQAATSLPEPDVEGLDADELEALLAELNADQAAQSQPSSNDSIDYLDQLQAELAKNTHPTPVYQNYTAAPATNVVVQQGQSQQPQQQQQQQTPVQTQQQHQQPVGSYAPVNNGAQNFQQPASVGGFHPINVGGQLQQNSVNIAQVPRRQASPSRGGGGRRQSRDPPSDEDEAKRLEKERIREENRERKKRWRETNTDRNKDNDLRCRVMKRAHRMFGDGNSEEKLAWIKDEFERRREKRMNKDKSRTDHTGSSGMFGISDPSYQRQEFTHLHHAQYSAAQIFDMFKRLLRGGNTNSMDYVVSYLGANPNITHDLLEMGRAHGIDLVNEAGLNHPPVPPPQIIQQPVQTPPVAAPQPEPEQQQDTPMAGLSGFEGIELPEGFEAIIADIQKTTENFRESPETGQDASPQSQVPAESSTAPSPITTEKSSLTQPEPAKQQPISIDEDLEASLEDLPEDEMAAILAVLREEEEGAQEEPEVKEPVDTIMKDAPATTPASETAPAPTPAPASVPTTTTTANPTPTPSVVTPPTPTPPIQNQKSHMDEALEELHQFSRADSPDLDLDNEGGVTDEDLEKLLKDTGMDMDALAGALDMDGDFSLGLIAPPQTPEEQEPPKDTSTNFDALFTELQQAAEAAVKDREQQNAQFQSQQFGQFGVSGSFSGSNQFYPYTRDSLMRMLSILVEKMPYQTDGSSAASALLAGQKRRASSPSGSYGYPGQHPSLLKRPRHAESATVQLEGILHSSMPGMIPRPPYQTPMMREVDTEAVNKRAMQLKPPPYRPPPKANSPPVGITPLDPPKEKGTEAEKKIKAMGFPPMMAGIRKPVSQPAPLMPQI